MTQRPKWEVLVGDNRKLDFLATKYQKDDTPHPLQEKVEELVETLLTDDEREVYHLRFGERMPHREIQELLGYKSHFLVQSIEKRIIAKIQEALENG